jgi:hypothetical protein
MGIPCAAGISAPRLWNYFSKLWLGNLNSGFCYYGGSICPFSEVAMRIWVAEGLLSGLTVSIILSSFTAFSEYFG